MPAAYSFTEFMCGATRLTASTASPIASSLPSKVICMKFHPRQPFGSLDCCSFGLRVQLAAWHSQSPFFLRFWFTQAQYPPMEKKKRCYDLPGHSKPLSGPWGLRLSSAVVPGRWSGFEEDSLPPVASISQKALTGRSSISAYHTLPSLFGAGYILCIALIFHVHCGYSLHT